MLYALFRTLHFIAILALTAALIIENMALKPTINGEDARNLAKVDAVYGVAAALTLLFGLSLWLWIGKPAEFYSQNPIFQLKLGLFFLLALLSIYPAIFFIRNRKSTATTIAVPRLIGVLTKLELMARGIGLNT
jgi:putative membrane protein